MFVFSMHISIKKIITFSIVLAVIAMSGIFIYSHKTDSIIVSTSKQYSFDANDNSKRVEFLTSYGWEINPEPIEICDIKIPSVFNSVYENYNQIQKNQGLDLKKYMGKSCKRFTYEVTNYPSHKGPVRANILAIENKLIAGDISSIELNGFMHGFKK